MTDDGGATCREYMTVTGCSRIVDSFTCTIYFDYRDVGRRLKCCVLHARREVLGVSQTTSIYLGFCVCVAYSIYHVACSSFLLVLIVL